MAVPEDYIGKRFGAFEIGSIIGSGSQAEIFECWHLINGRRYALKLDIRDDPLWDGDQPMLPPCNGRPSGVWVGIRKVKLLAAGSAGGFQRLTPDYFAVVGDTWVEPLTVAGRVRDAVRYDWLVRYQLDGCLDRAFERSHIWQDCVFAMLTNVYDAPPALFEERWGSLWGGGNLKAFASDAAAAGIISRELAVKLGQDSALGFGLEENTLFWLLTAADADDITTGTALATLRCPLFRLNIPNVEVVQLIQLHAALAASDVPVAARPHIKATRTAVATALESLGQLPFTPTTDPDQFVLDKGIPISADSPYLDGVILMSQIGSSILDGRWSGTPSS